MEFIAIILAFIPMRYLRIIGLFQWDGLVMRFRSVLGMWTVLARRPVMLAFLVALLPVLLLGGLVYLVQDIFFGIPKLLILVVTLMYSMGRGSFSADVADYLQTWRSADRDGPRLHLLKTFYIAEQAKDNYGLIHSKARSYFFYRGLERFFVALFWFCVAGPFIPVFYRVMFLMRYARFCDIGQTDPRDDHVYRRLNRTLYWIEWLPVRVLGFSYAFMGDFVRCLQSWRSTLIKPYMGSAQVLNENGLAALSLDMHCLVFDSTLHDTGSAAGQEALQAFVDEAEREIGLIKSFTSRTLMLWITAIALLQLFL